MAESLWEKFVKEIPAEKLEPSVVEILKNSTAPVAVACSGGPDSVAAALVVKALAKAPLTLLHFDHRLRGGASKRDAEFVRKLAHDIGADFRLGVWEHPDKKNELAAREARMAFLHQWEHEAIVFGHHADDAVESFLMRLARGAGPVGLCAPHAINKVGRHLHLRPLLPLRKSEIIKALEACKIAFRHDKTNFGNGYLRNRIRNKLLPLWQKIETRDVASGILASQKELQELLPSYAAAHPHESEEAEEFQTFPRAYSASLPVGTTLFLPFGATLSAERVPAPTLEHIKANSDPLRRVWVSDHKRPLKIRPWTRGETYRPLGTGARKIKSILNENCGHVPVELRALWPLVLEQEVPIWLPGARITRQAPLKPGEPTSIELRFCPPPPSIAKNDL